MASQKTCKTVDTKDVVKKAIKELKNEQLIPDYEKHETKITEVLKKAAQTEATLTSKMSHMIDNNTMPEIEKEMKAVIGHERVGLIKKSFDIETYRMKLVEKPDGQSAVQVHRNGVACHPEIMLSSVKDTKHVSMLQMTSLSVEIFVFVLSCAGVPVEINEAEMAPLLREAEVFLEEPAFQKALNELVVAWNEAGGSALVKAKAIFVFLKDSFSLGIFWKIINLIFQRMSTWDIILSTGEVTVMIVAAFATDGLALIARIALAIDGAYHLEQKIANIGLFSDMEKKLK